jgi:hypothetical protein
MNGWGGLTYNLTLRRGRGTPKDAQANSESTSFALWKALTTALLWTHTRKGTILEVCRYSGSQGQTRCQLFWVKVTWRLAGQSVTRLGIGHFNPKLTKRELFRMWVRGLGGEQVKLG